MDTSKSVACFSKGSISFIKGGKYPHCHSVLIRDRLSAVIDAASSREGLLAFKESCRVDAVITSHAHEDHFLYNALFLDSELWVHEADAHAFSDIASFIGIYDPGEEEAKLWEEFLIKEVGYVPRKVDRILKDSDVLNFGHTSCRVIHAPGHTPGHCCFHFPEERVLYLADIDLVSAGPYYGDPSSDLDQTIASISKLMEIDVDTYLTAHGKGVHEGDPDLLALYLRKVFDREEAVLDCLSSGPKALSEVTAIGIIYGASKSLGAWDLTVSERHMMDKHLKRLVRQGRAVFEDGHYLLAS